VKGSCVYVWCELGYSSATKYTHMYRAIYIYPPFRQQPIEVTEVRYGRRGMLWEFLRSWMIPRSAIRANLEEEEGTRIRLAGASKAPPPYVRFRNQGHPPRSWLGQSLPVTGVAIECPFFIFQSFKLFKLFKLLGLPPRVDWPGTPRAPCKSLAGDKSFKL
jgi:hypothetical protein